MNPYRSTVDLLLTIPVVQDWPELRTLLTQAAAREPKHWQLPVRACEAVGKPADQAIPAVAAIACAQVSILLIDDMLDEDPRGEYHHAGPAKTANYAAAFQAAGLEVLLQNDWQPPKKLSALQNINQMIMILALGQHLDVQASIDERVYWKIVENKSASFFGTAFYLGALLGEASNEISSRLEQIGRLYGAMIQIHDDLNDTMAVPANPDWLQARSPLPILFAKAVDHPERSRFLELCGEITDKGALREAQDILVRCGAVSYCVEQLLCRYQSARELLQTVELARPELIESLLEEVVAPVWKLFEAVEVSPPRTAIS
jgi:geranylgeranyl pyrophosphate synthase